VQEDGETLLFVAAFRSDKARGAARFVSLLLQHGANPDQQDATLGRSVLHHCCNDDDVDEGLASILIEAGADLHMTDKVSTRLLPRLSSSLPVSPRLFSDCSSSSPPVL
jgi:ankyrin repeat protein